MEFLNYNGPLDIINKVIPQLIPGKFQNDEWVAMDGLFGMYFNKITLELIGGPQPMII